MILFRNDEGTQLLSAFLFWLYSFNQANECRECETETNPSFEREAVPDQKQISENDQIAMQLG